MGNIYEESCKLHEKNQGKIGTYLKMSCETKEDLCLAYSPGVAGPCIEIAKDRSKSYVYTNRANTIAIISDGTAVLGLGDIGPEAAMPVMEGKGLLLCHFAGLDVVPLVLDTKDPEKIIDICKAIAPSFGAINLEDISAPRCVYIERRLKKELNIPVFHDDQHGTAIVVLAALINYLKLTNKWKEKVKVIISGTGAAGSSIIRTLYKYGFKNIIAFDKDGCLVQDQKENYDFLKQELLEYVNLDNVHYLSLAEAMKDADIFIGVSTKGLVTKEMVKSMNEKQAIFAMANPEPEITYEDAKEAGCYCVGTGRSDYPNQINNLLAFPGIFKGALNVRAKKITDEMKMAASIALANIVKEEELNKDYIIPNPYDERVVPYVSKAVAEAWKKYNQ